MLPNRKSSLGQRAVFILTSLSAIGSWVATASDDVPVGYNADRYQQIWVRNPFTIVTPVVAAAQPKVFDKFVLLSWLNDAGKDVVFVQNIETNEVQKVTSDPNPNGFRLIAIHKAADPKNAEVVLSSGTEEGTVKFRLDTAAAAPQNGAGQPVAGAQNQVPGGAIAPAPIMTRPAQMLQNAPQAPRYGANQPGTVQTQPETAVPPPRASEVRRKRITAPPTVEQPVGVPAPAQNIPSQPQTQ
jgi:hypothetical protein